MTRLRAIAVMLLLCAAATEVAGFAAYRALTGTWFSPSTIRAEQDRAIALQKVVEAGQTFTSGVTTPIVPHPYIGFAQDPHYDVAGTRQMHGVPASEWGFLDDKPPVRPRDDGEVVIGLTGGSVAFWFSMQGADAMIAELAQLEAFRGKRFVLVRTALGGMKQPQQLAILTYLLALGAHFDLLLNIDGFNEVALPPATLIVHKIFPFFPRDWADLLGRTGDPVRVRLVGEITYLQKSRGDLAESFSRPPWRWSPLAACVWTLRDRALDARIARLQQTLATEGQNGGQTFTRYAGLGPARAYATSDDMYADLVNVWRESSRQMHRLATANGIPYFHVLQPNQYVEGSKPMSADERSRAVAADSPHAPHVRAGYPRLREAGRALAAEGVRFVDLTDIFSDVSAPLYEDRCCHFSAKGNVIMGHRIGRLMRDALRK